MKGLILAGGRGKRLEGRCSERNKCMLDFAGKPLIEYSLENCARLGPDEIVVVVGYLAEQIVSHFGASFRGIRLTYAVQREQRGLVHAIESAAPFLGGADFMLFLADEILLQPNHAAMIERYRSGGIFSLCGVTKPADPQDIRKTYAILEDQDGRILRLIEKPRRPIGVYQGSGNILFNGRILDYLACTPINQARKERELPDLIQCAIDDGLLVQSFLVGGRYININTPEDLRQAESELRAGIAEAAYAS